MNELYELLLEKAKDQVKNETSLSDDSYKLISTILKVYHATQRNHTPVLSGPDLPPVITAE